MQETYEQNDLIFYSNWCMRFTFRCISNKMLLKRPQLKHPIQLTEFVLRCRSPARGMSDEINRFSFKITSEASGFTSRIKGGESQTWQTCVNLLVCALAMRNQHVCSAYFFCRSSLLVFMEWKCLNNKSDWLDFERHTTKAKDKELKRTREKGKRESKTKETRTNE